MKTFLTAIILLLCLGTMAQKTKSQSYSPITFHTGNSSFFKGCWIGKGSDTLNVADTSIHFIKIGEQVFEIKRSVTLEPPKLKESLGGYFLPYQLINPPLIQYYNNNKNITPAISTTK